MSKPRYTISGFWRGRLVHRTVTTMPRQWDGLAGVVFGDGTTMDIDIARTPPRERVEERHGYSELLKRLAWNPICKKGFVNVGDL